MKHWTASVVASLLACFPGVVSAQANCEAIPHGPARTDCYLGLGQFYRGQSDLAAARARAQSDTAWYRAITGTDPPKHKTTLATINAQTTSRAEAPKKLRSCTHCVNAKDTLSLSLLRARLIDLKLPIKIVEGE
jgi:hypothetical protein